MNMLPEVGAAALAGLIHIGHVAVFTYGLKHIDPTILTDTPTLQDAIHPETCTPKPPGTPTPTRGGMPAILTGHRTIGPKLLAHLACVPDFPPSSPHKMQVASSAKPSILNTLNPEHGPTPPPRDPQTTPGRHDTTRRPVHHPQLPTPT